MATDYLLEIDGIQGESGDSKYPHAIEVRAFGWGAENQGSFGTGGGGGAGKVRFQDIHISAPASKASPLLAVACASGQHIKKAQLIVRKQGKQQHEYYVIALENLLVSQYSARDGGAVDIVPLDDFSLNFAKIEFRYRVQRDDGSLEPAITTTWDLRQNKGS